MIKTEYYITREDGVVLNRTYTETDEPVEAEVPSDG